MHGTHNKLGHMGTSGHERVIVILYAIVYNILRAHDDIIVLQLHRQMMSSCALDIYTHPSSPTQVW